jgi:chromosome segregation ATPase
MDKEPVIGTVRNADPTIRSEKTWPTVADVAALQYPGSIEAENKSLRAKLAEVIKTWKDNYSQKCQELAAALGREEGKQVIIKRLESELAAANEKIRELKAHTDSVVEASRASVSEWRKLEGSLFDGNRSERRKFVASFTKLCVALEILEKAISRLEKKQYKEPKP